MPTFRIDLNNNITVVTSLKKVAGGEGERETFTSLQELAALAAHWPGSRLVAIWNHLPGMQPIPRFTSKQVGVSRLWKAVQPLKPAGGARGRPGALMEGSATETANPTPQANSKAAQLVALLQQPQGATLKAIMLALGWQAHSVRGFISRQLGKKMGLRVRSFKRNGERVYALKG
jgi:hypothetical protein